MLCWVSLDSFTMFMFIGYQCAFQPQWPAVSLLGFLQAAGMCFALCLRTAKNALGLIPHTPAIALNQRPTCKCILILRVLAPSWGQLWATISTVFKMFPWAWTGPSLWASLHNLLPFPDPFSMTSAIFFWEHFLISNIHRNPHVAVCFWETGKSTFALFGVRVSI